MIDLSSPTDWNPRLVGRAAVAATGVRVWPVTAVVALSITLGGGCTQSSTEGIESEPTKEEAQRMAAGKADFDCPDHWYGDGWCDGYCALPDPDCGSHCPDPTETGVIYRSCFTTDIFTCPDDSSPFVDPGGCGCGCEPVDAPACPDWSEPANLHHSCFTLDAWTCPAGTEQIVDPGGCGCGCVPVDPPICPDPADPEVAYHSCLTFDLLVCPDSTEPFVDPAGCGCGCAPVDPPICPDPADPEVAYHSCLTFDLLVCPDGAEPFVDPTGCGCGCAPVDPPICPDPADPGVHYMADSNHDPMRCAAILFACESGEVPFSNDCGCGCVGDEA